MPSKETRRVWLKSSGPADHDHWLDPFVVESGVTGVKPIIYDGRRWIFSDIYRQRDLKRVTEKDWLMFVDGGPATD